MVMLFRGGHFPRAALVAVSLLFAPTLAWSINFDNDLYGSLSDYLEEIYGIDDNAGLTAFPILNAPMGGKAEGMAGAFTAIADDVSSIEWNPAASARLTRTEVAFYHNNWIADTKIDGLAFGMKLGNFGIAAATKWMYTPFTEYSLWGDRIAKGYYAEGVGILNASVNLFPGYYFRGLSLGVSVKPAFRLVPDFTDSDSDEATVDTQEVIEGSGKSQSAMALMTDLGLLMRFNFLKLYNSRDENLSIAFVVRNLGVPDISFRLTEDPLPTVAVGAISYRPFRPLVIAFEYAIPVNLNDIELSEKPYYTAGVSLSIARFLSMRTGLMLRAGAVRAAIGSSVSLERVSFDINYTLDLATQIQPLNRVSMGIRIDLGDMGRSRILRQIDDFYLTGLDMYNIGNDTDAKRLWEEALKLNPHFDPALEGLLAIRKSQDLQKRVMEMQNTMDRESTSPIRRRTP